MVSYSTFVAVLLPFLVCVHSASSDDVQLVVSQIKSILEQFADRLATSQTTDSSQVEWVCSGSNTVLKFVDDVVSCMSNPGATTTPASCFSDGASFCNPYDVTKAKAAIGCVVNKVDAVIQSANGDYRKIIAKFVNCAFTAIF